MAEEDTERLDKVERLKAIIQPHGPGCCGWYLLWPDDNESSGDTLRDAIDAAE